MFWWGNWLFWNFWWVCRQLTLNLDRNSTQNIWVESHESIINCTSLYVLNLSSTSNNLPCYNSFSTVLHIYCCQLFATDYLSWNAVTSKRTVISSDMWLLDLHHPVVVSSAHVTVWGILWFSYVVFSAVSMWPNRKPETLSECHAGIKLSDSVTLVLHLCNGAWWGEAILFKCWSLNLNWGLGWRDDFWIIKMSDRVYMLNINSIVYKRYI